MNTLVASNGAANVTESRAVDKPDCYEQLFELWNQSSSSRRNTTIEAYGLSLRQFADFVDRKALNALSRRDVVAFRDHLLATGRSDVTVTQRVGMLRALFATAVNHELIKENPADNIRAQSKLRGKQRVAFSSEDLRAIFNSRIYTQKYLPIGGGYEAAYWLPLLALFTGARIEELAQLLVRDIHQADGLGYYINITDEGEHQHLKNQSSRRRVPIHPQLVACGFIDYVTRLGQTERLFPDLKPNPRGKLGGYFSNFFSIYLRKGIGLTDPRKVFHSFRHTFKEVCRKVGIEEAVHDALTGHTGPSVGRRYGNELYPLEPLFEAMEQFEIADFNLAHLHTQPYERRLRATDLRIVTVFYGLVIAFTAGRRQNDMGPFIVAIWQDNEAAIQIANNQILWGELPANKLLLVSAWIEIHKEELLANWHAGRITGEFFKLDPLR